MYLDRSAFPRYKEELKQFSPEDFHIGPIETSRKAYVRICCGGNADARLKGFAELFGTEDTYLVGGDFAASNSLIGYMEAQMIILFFEGAADYRKWVDDGVELDFLRYNDNSQKTFAVSCPDRLDLEEISELVGTEVTTDLDWRQVEGAKLKPNSYIDSMVMIPSGSAPYQSEPTLVPRDARGMYFSDTYITDTEGCDVEGAVFYGCQRYVDGALNYAVGEGDICSNIRRPLLVGQSLITQGLYEYVMGRNPSDFKGSSELPVEKVSWFDLLHFCNKLSEIQGFRPCYYDIGSGWEGSAEWDRSANGYRLLTEREWEYIARANRTFEYSGSDDPSEVAWYEENSGRKTHPVGTKKENSFGTYDQSGNLFEWCWDCTNPKYADRVLRGGGWYDLASHVRAAGRRNNYPSIQYNHFGGRLARSPDPLIP
jgi:formylglycine-generating enzyme required for sulfatase activity